MTDGVGFYLLLAVNQGQPWISVPNNFSLTALYPQEVLVMALKALLTLYFSSAFSFPHLQEITWTKIAEKHISSS